MSIFQLYCYPTQCSWKNKYLDKLNMYCSQDEWAWQSHTDYVTLILAYIKVSVENESLTTSSVWVFVCLSQSQQSLCADWAADTLNTTQLFKVSCWQNPVSKNNYFSRLLSCFTTAATPFWPVDTVCSHIRCSLCLNLSDKGAAAVATT